MRNHTDAAKSGDSSGVAGLGKMQSSLLGDALPGNTSILRPRPSEPLTTPLFSLSPCEEWEIISKELTRNTAEEGQR